MPGTSSGPFAGFLAPESQPPSQGGSPRQVVERRPSWLQRRVSRRGRSPSPQPPLPPPDSVPLRQHGDIFSPGAPVTVGTPADAGIANGDPLLMHLAAADVALQRLQVSPSSLRAGSGAPSASVSRRPSLSVSTPSRPASPDARLARAHSVYSPAPTTVPQSRTPPDAQRHPRWPVTPKVDRSSALVVHTEPLYPSSTAWQGNETSMSYAASPPASALPVLPSEYVRHSAQPLAQRTATIPAPSSAPLAASPAVAQGKNALDSTPADEQSSIDTNPGWTFDHVGSSFSSFADSPASELTDTPLAPKPLSLSLGEPTKFAPDVTRAPDAQPRHHAHIRPCPPPPIVACARGDGTSVPILAPADAQAMPSVTLDRAPDGHFADGVFDEHPNSALNAPRLAHLEQPFSEEPPRQRAGAEEASLAPTHLRLGGAFLTSGPLRSALLSESDTHSWTSTESTPTTPVQDPERTHAVPQAIELVQTGAGRLSVVSSMNASSLDDELCSNVSAATTHLSMQHCPLPPLRYNVLRVPETLVVLDVSSSSLTYLPEELQCCHALEELNLSNNPLGSAPAKATWHHITRLPSLRVLLADVCELDEIPFEFSELRNLQILGLRRNRLTHLPSWLYVLSHLHCILLEGNMHLFKPWIWILQPLLDPTGSVVLALPPMRELVAEMMPASVADSTPVHRSDADHGHAAMPAYTKSTSPTTTPPGPDHRKGTRSFLNMAMRWTGSNMSLRSPLTPNERAALERSMASLEPSDVSPARPHVSARGAHGTSSPTSGRTVSGGSLAAPSAGDKSPRTPDGKPSRTPPVLEDDRHGRLRSVLQRQASFRSLVVPIRSWSQTTYQPMFSISSPYAVRRPAPPGDPGNGLGIASLPKCESHSIPCFLPVYNTNGHGAGDQQFRLVTNTVQFVRNLLAYLRDLDDLRMDRHQERSIKCIARLHGSPGGTSASGTPASPGTPGTPGTPSLASYVGPFEDSMLEVNTVAPQTPRPVEASPGDRVGAPPGSGLKATPTSATESTLFATPGHGRSKDNSERRRNLLREIVETERTYVAGLRELMDIYVKRARQPIDGSSTDRVLPVAKERAIFGHIEGIVYFHTDAFLPSLEAAAQPVLHAESAELGEDEDALVTTRVAVDVANAFTQHSAYFKMYMNYVNQYESAVRRIARWTEPVQSRTRTGLKPAVENATSSTLTQLAHLGHRLHFRGDATPPDADIRPTGAVERWDELSSTRRRRIQLYLKRCREDARHSQLNLEGYLLLPIQRIPRYRMLLEQLVHCTDLNKLSPEDADALTRALAHVSLVASWVNEGKRQSEQGRRLLTWQSKLHGKFSAPLVQPHRRLISDGAMRLRRVLRRVGPSPETCEDIDVLEQTSVDQPVHLLLCNDLAVVVTVLKENAAFDGTSKPVSSAAVPPPTPAMDPNDVESAELTAVMKPCVCIPPHYDRALQLPKPPATIIGRKHLRIVDSRHVFYFTTSSNRDAIYWRDMINSQPF
ncbi:hypothetical protein MSPP1_002317 [Malassezia sp. CBS 17886]|nr:hypothetical protein MSPP1_002317 [Malassezia sp. CBS 17886]